VWSITARTCDVAATFGLELIARPVNASFAQKAADHALVA
ncbi:unnamed protein product, partial [Strongylus vulgaris]